MENSSIFYTYAYLRENGTPYYIGKGSGDRINQKSNRNCPKPKNKSKIIFLKQNISEQEAFNHEKYMIAIFGRKDLRTGILRNLTDGGEGSTGAIRSNKTRNQISKKLKGRTISEEHKKRLSEIHKGSIKSEETKKLWSKQRKGKKPSEETKIKMSEKKKGSNHNMFEIPRSEETKRKISEALKGKTHSEETKRKMSESRKGKTHSEETKRKISEALKGRKINN